MLNISPQQPFASAIDLAVAIALLPNQHAGLIYILDGSPPQLLHFATHFKLLNQIPSDNYRWVQVDIDELTRRNLAGLCSVIARKNAQSPMQIPYGLRFKKGDQYFTVDGDFLENGINFGLTCSTFILAIFRTFFVELLDTNDWYSEEYEKSEQDTQFETWITEYLSKEFGNPLAKALKEQIGSPRFVPVQVTAGAASPTKPLGLAEANSLSEILLKNLEDSYRPNDTEEAPERVC